MAKVTSKLQVTIPKAIADRHGLRPGDEIEWVSTGDAIRVAPVVRSKPHLLRRMPYATKANPEFGESTSRFLPISAGSTSICTTWQPSASGRDKAGVEKVPQTFFHG